MLAISYNAFIDKMKNLSGPNVDACVRFIITKIAGYVAKKKDARSCLCCGIQQSVTWRPSDFGRNTLCNRCGLKWIHSAKRERTLDVVLMQEEHAVWVVKKSGHWTVLCEADATQKRVSDWIMRQRKRKQLANLLHFNHSRKKQKI